MKVKIELLEAGGSGRYGGKINEAQVLRWHKQVSEKVSKGEDLVDLETDKAVFTLQAPASGIMLSIEYIGGETCREGSALGIIETEETSQTETVKAVPAARELAREERIDLKKIKGSGDSEIIKLADVESRIVKVPESPTKTKPKSDRRAVLASMLQRSMAKHLEKSWRDIPHAGDTITIDITSLAAYREHNKATWQKLTGLKLRYDHFFMYFAAQHLTIANFKILNAYWDKEAESIVESDDVNLGLAVETPKGLAVAVIKESQKLNFLELVKATEEKISRAKASKLTYEDITDLTFTIDNSGRLGGENPSPIIPYALEANGKERPTGMIIALSKIFAEGGASKIRAVFRFDHCLTDGLAPTKFVLKMKEYFEEIKNSDEWTRVFFENN